MPRDGNTLLYSTNKKPILSRMKDGKDALTTVEIGSDELAKQAVSDIRRDIDGWSVWTDYGDMSGDEKSSRKNNLLALCELLLRYV